MFVFKYRTSIQNVFFYESHCTDKLFLYIGLCLAIPCAPVCMLSVREDSQKAANYKPRIFVKFVRKKSATASGSDAVFGKKCHGVTRIDGVKGPK